MVIIKKPLPNPKSRKFTPKFKSSMVLALTFKSTGHFESFLCIIWDRGLISFFICKYPAVLTLFVENIQLFSHYLLKDSHFLIELLQHPYCKKFNCKCELISRLYILFHWSICLTFCKYHAALITTVFTISFEIRKHGSANFILQL